jgi:hypothetical protein
MMNMQFSGWACTLEEKLRLPLKCLVFGEEARLVKIDTDENGTAVLGIIIRDKKKVRVPIQDLKVADESAECLEWLEAYKCWLGAEKR